MAIYCIGYDLIKEKNYEKLFEKIKSYGTYAHGLDSMWFIKSSKSASEIRDELKPFVDEDDMIIVIKVILPWASSNLSKEVADWLKKADF